MKRMFTTLAVASVITTTGFAGTFSDVPANHWAYKSVEQLSSRGIIKGWNEKFNGNDTITRYQMAVLIGRMLDAVDKGAPTDSAATASLSRLVTEFSNELALIGAKVDAIEARTISNEKRIEDLEDKVKSPSGSGKLNWSGKLGFRWESLFNDGMSDRVSSDPQVRFQLDLGGRTNDKVSWGASLLTVGDDAPASSWKSFGNNAGGSGVFGGNELRLHKYWFHIKATDKFNYTIGKQENPFRNTELIFDKDIAPAGLTQEYKIDDNWTIRAGQYFLRDGVSLNAAGTAAVAQSKEDIYLFAHQVEFKHEGFGGEWKANMSNLNFSGEQFLHSGQGLNARYFNTVPTFNSVAFNSNVARSGNYYNVTADGSLNNQGNAAHNANATTLNRQLRLMSDFNIFNTYVEYKNTDDKMDPWGVKFDFARNNSAWNGDDTAYWFELYRGELNRKGSVEYGYAYKRVEADAVLSFLNKEYLLSNVKGSSVFFKTRVQDNLDWFTTFFLFEPVHGVALDKQGLFRTGLKVKF